MKKFLKIFFISLAALILLLLVTPFLFKNKIMEFAKKEINNMLTAEVDFSNLRLSFIRNFPNAYVALEDLTVVGTGDFEGDTLVAFDKFSVTVDIKSVIGLSNIQVKAIILDRPHLYAHVLKDGRPNWDIMKPSDEETPEEEEELPDDSEFAGEFNVALKKFEIKDAKIVYFDEPGNMKASLDGFNFLLKGDMSLERTILDIKTGINELDFWMDGIRMLKKAEIQFDSEIDADLTNMAFAFKENMFRINDIVLKFDGEVKMPEEDIDVDITFATDKTDFKSLLSLIPAIYMQDFEAVQTAGSLELNGSAQGTLNDKQTPSAKINLAVNNAMFKYPDLPKSVENINIAVKVAYDGVVFDRTTVDVDNFSFTMAGNPFKMDLHVKTPDSDMQIAANFDGKIDFNSMADIIPLDDTKLLGLLECDLSLAGRMSTLENEQYEDFKADGLIKLSNFLFESPDFPQGVTISQTHLEFSPKIVSLKAFDAVIGRTDISMNGSLENFIPFVFKEETVKGRLALNSKRIDLNEFMSDEETPVEESAEDVPMSIIEIPKNVDFTLTANLETIIFDKLNISNTKGEIIVRDGAVNMQRLAMNLLDGSLVVSGQYNTSDINKPFIDLDLDVSKFNIPTTLSSFSMLETFFPEPKDYKGNVSAKFKLNSLLDSEFSPVMTSVYAKGRLQTQNLEVHNSKLFVTMADMLKNEKLRVVRPNDMNIGFELVDGRMNVEPFEMKIDQAKIGFSGDQGIDMTMNYNLKISVPKSAVGAGADLLNKIPGGTSINELIMNGHIGGTVTNPDVKINFGDMGDVLKDAIKEVITEKVEEIKGKVTDEINAQIEKILAEANKQAENIRNTAKQAADKVRQESETAAKKAISEANAAADKIEKEAKNPLEKAAKKAAADEARKKGEDLAKKLRSEGESKAKGIEAEGDKNAKAVMDNANKQADALRQ
ncbi:MAG: AsmA family protein [Marinilabiliaceae bacterium]|nr:AsmA family protein [Marinilabiliaceae bacterium]